MCHWMVRRGARKIIITSRSGVTTAYQLWKINLFKRKGANIKVSKLDVGDYNEATKLLEEAEALGPIGGIFHVAAVSLYSL